MRLIRTLVPLGLLLVSCSRTSGTVEIPGDELPFSVARAPTPSASPAPAGTFTLYLVRRDGLVAARRDIQTEGSITDAVLRTLLDGPTRGERAQGISSHIPSAVRLLDVSIFGDVARVDLSGEFQEPAPSERITLRVAQVVWTLTGLPGIGSVAFAIDGETVAVTRGDGTSVSEPVTRDDYATVAPAT